jgi:hypothetical protein
MKALSGYAEWFWLMAKNIKPVENRPWPIYKNIELPMRIYLHASKTKSPKSDIEFIKRRLTLEQLLEFNTVDWSQYRGHIIGEITITHRVTADDISFKEVQSVWFFGPYGFVVKDGKLYDKPILYKGQLGFFNVNIEVTK